MYFQNLTQFNTNMSKKSVFRGPFDSQHGKRAQTLLQSERQPYNHIL